MARTYAPSKVSEVVALWKADLAKVNKKAAEVRGLYKLNPVVTHSA
jgi:hypothetical protein